MLRSFTSYFSSNGRSKKKDAQVVEAEERFTPDELQRLRSSFRRASPNSTSAHLSYATFLAWFHLVDLDQDLANALCRALDRGSKDGISFDDLLVGLKSVVKGSERDRAKFVFNLLDASGQGKLRPEDVVRGAVEAGKRILKSDAAEVETLRLVAKAVAAGAMTGERGKVLDELSFDEFQTWATKVPSVVRVLGSLMNSWQDMPLEPALVIPKLSLSQDAKDKGTMLNPSWLWLLCGRLPPKQCEEWELLFTSRVHGASFNTFLGNISKKGVTLVIIRDKEDHTFGGLATVPWEKSGTFFGDYSSFIFSVTPTFNVYKASGGNENFQWCGQGFHEIPNGVGFGGQMNYFSLFVDDSFENGMSRPTVTYGSPCLASNEVFKVKEVECWLVEPVEEDPWCEKNTKSILDRNMGDQKVLELAGKVKYSDGLRAEDEEG